MALADHACGSAAATAAAEGQDAITVEIRYVTHD